MVGIVTSCAGIYSMSLFISGFIAFILVECQRMDKRVGLFLSLGILLIWIANISRITIIEIVGSYYGHEALLWTHKYLGEVIFISWIALFWLMLFKYLTLKNDTEVLK